MPMQFKVNSFQVPPHEVRLLNMHINKSHDAQANEPTQNRVRRMANTYLKIVGIQKNLVTQKAVFTGGHQMMD